MSVITKTLSLTSKYLSILLTYPNYFAKFLYFNYNEDYDFIIV